jgi:stage II sporulation protein AA (anti-sigma F factor antagonist)
MQIRLFSRRIFCSQHRTKYPAKEGDEMALHIKERKVDTRLIIYPEGELDIFTIESLISRIDRISDSTCEVNLSDVSFIDSSGIGLLMRKVMDWRETNRNLIISEFQPLVYEAMSEMGAFIIMEEVYR